MIESRPSISGVRWMGVDFGYTIMDPLKMHHSFVIPEIYRRLGREGEGRDRLARWYKLRDSLGTTTDQPHQRVRLLKEYNRDRMYDEVFDDDQKAIELYSEMEAMERKVPPDLKGTLEHLESKGWTAAVVSEVVGIQGTMTISASLRLNGLAPLFAEIITPSGRFSTAGQLIDEETFKGSTKKDGSIYRRLAGYLDAAGIIRGRRAMVGDDPKQDIELAKAEGFITIQYCGIIDRGKSEMADLVIKSWSELGQMV